MDKVPLVVGNWKMELSHKGAIEVFGALKKLMQDAEFPIDVAVCPSFPSLSAIADMAKDTMIAIGAQNVHHEERGAYTGKVSVAQVRDFVSLAIVGHSEVRAEEGDDDTVVVQKARLLLTHGITPVVCVGETLNQYESGETTQAVLSQIDALIRSIDRVSLLKTVIAYEPVWAIGTGNMPDPNDVYGVMLSIRKRIAGTFDGELAERVRLLYGGSVKGDNVGSYITGAGVDGVLVGGASVHPRDFVQIISEVAKVYVR